MDGELKEDREKDIKVEDVVQRPLAGELLDGLEEREIRRMGQSSLHQDKHVTAAHLGA